MELTLFFAGVAIAPLIAFIMGGWALLLFRGKEVPFLCLPLAGILGMGWVLQTAQALALFWQWIAAAFVVINIFAWLCDRNRIPMVGRGALLFYQIYLFFLVVMSVSLLPGLFRWGMDWVGILLYAKMPVDYERCKESIGLLGRNPFFSLSGLWLQMLTEPLLALQIHSALAATAVVGVCRHAMQVIFGRAVRLAFFWPLLLSAPAVHHVLVFWSKWMLAGVVVWSVAEAVSIRRGDGNGSRFRCALWLSLGVACHQSVILYVPLVVILMLEWSKGRRWREIFGSIGIFTVVGMGICGIYEIWVFYHLGSVRVTANPSLAQCSGDPVVVRWALNLVSALTGWMPAALWIRWMNSNEGSQSFLLWAISDWVATMSGTLLMIAIPYWAVAGESVKKVLRKISKKRWILLVLGSGAVVVGQSLLSPYYCYYGLAQNALWPLVILAYLAWLGLGQPEVGVLRKLVWVQCIIGLFPILLASGVRCLVFHGLLQGSEWERIRKEVLFLDPGGAGDYSFFIQMGGKTMATEFMPWVQIGLLVALVTVTLVVVKWRGA